MPLLNLSEGIRGRESLTTGRPSIGLSRGIMSGRPRILAPSIRPFGSTQDRRWISKKARASPASASNYERYVLCSLGVHRLLRYPGLTLEMTAEICTFARCGSVIVRNRQVFVCRRLPTNKMRSSLRLCGEKFICDNLRESAVK